MGGVGHGGSLRLGHSPWVDDKDSAVRGEVEDFGGVYRGMCTRERLWEKHRKRVTIVHATFLFLLFVT